MALEMEPRSATVNGGDAIAFAVKDGGAPVPVESWELSGGGTLRDGVFTAPKVSLHSVHTVVTARTAAGSVAAEVTTSPAKQWIMLLGAYFALVVAGGVWGVFWLFELTKNKSTAEGWLFLLMSALCGGLGSCLHGINSLTAYVGAKQFQSSWSLYYMARPVVGGILGPLMFLVFRSNLVPDAQQVNTNDWLAVAALTGISGLFADKAVEKLKQVVDVVFSVPKDARPDKLEKKAQGSGQDEGRETAVGGAGEQQAPATEGAAGDVTEEVKKKGAGA